MAKVSSLVSQIGLENLKQLDLLYEEFYETIIKIAFKDREDEPMGWESKSWHSFAKDLKSSQGFIKQFIEMRESRDRFAAL